MAKEKVEVFYHEHSVSREDREKLNGHKGCVLWFTGLSASGKSTIGNLVDKKLYELGVRSVLLDGDNTRHGLNLNSSPQILKTEHDEAFADRFGLGFSAQDREENIRRIGCVAKLFSEAGIVAMTAFISPYQVDRDRARILVREGDFIEVFVDAPLEVCESRDPKGLYRRVRAGEIKHFTGIDDPYEAPKRPELVLDAGSDKTAEELAQEVVEYLRAVGKIS